MWIMALNTSTVNNGLNEHEYTFPLQFNVNNGIKRAQTFEYTFPLQFNVNNGIKRAQTFERE